jgi:hypothetical protein
MYCTGIVFNFEMDLKNIFYEKVGPFGPHLRLRELRLSVLFTKAFFSSCKYVIMCLPWESFCPHVHVNSF